jgi:hypothetical protein
MSKYIEKKPKTYRRMKPRTPLVVGDVESADVVTHRRIAVTQPDGTQVISHVLESLDPSPALPTVKPIQIQASSSTTQLNYDDIHVPNMSPPPTPQPRRSRVRIFNLVISRVRYNILNLILDSKGLHTGVCSSR